MLESKSILNPHAAPYVPLAVYLEEKNVSGKQLNEKGAAAELPADGLFPCSESIDYDIQNFDGLSISKETKPMMSHIYTVDTIDDELNGLESQYLMDDQNWILDSLSAMFPNISKQSLAELFNANDGDLIETIEMLQQLEDCETSPNSFQTEDEASMSSDSTCQN